MDFGVRMSATHDTNVARSSKAQAAIRDLTPEDTYYTVAGTVDLVQPLGKQAVFLQGNAGYTFYDKNKNLSSRSADLTGGALKSFGRACQGMVSGGYGADLGQIDDVIGEIVDNVREQTNMAASLGCQPANGFGFALSANHDETRNSAALQETQDSDTDSAAVVLSYSRPSLGTFRLIANFSETKYPHRDPLLATALGDQISVSSYGVSVERTFGNRLEVNGTAQRTLIKRDKAPVGTPLKTTATVYDAQLKYHAGTRLDLRLSGNRSVTPSNRIGQLFDITRELGAVATYRLGTRVEVEAGYRNERTASSGSGAVVLGPILTNSDKDVIFGGVRYRRTGGFSLGLTARHEDRETNLPSFDYTATIVAVSLDVPF